MEKWLPNTRLDRYLIQTYPVLSKGQIEKFLRQKDIRINGKKAEGAHRLHGDDTLTISNFAQKIIDNLSPHKPKSELQLSPEFITLMKQSIVWEDDDIIVFNKPGGVAVQGGSGVVESIDAFLNFCFKGAKLVHRLDQATSGVLVVAKNLQVAQFLTKAFFDKTIQKTYWALVCGKLFPAYGAIKEPVVYQESYQDMPVSKAAHTQYRTLKNLEKKLSWVELQPITGRKHQLRIHMQHLEAPILGDTKYGDHDQQVPLMLHAREITLPSIGGEKLTFVARPPHAMENVLTHYNIDWNRYV